MVKVGVKYTNKVLPVALWTKMGACVHSSTLHKENANVSIANDFLLSSCCCATSTTGAFPTGPDIFVVSRQAGAFPSGREPLLAKALSEAGSKCSSMGKAMKLVSTKENPGLYLYGNYPKATIIVSFL